jgi:predicted ATPase/DNA-binding CsgD family transcriptional regulator
VATTWVPRVDHVRVGHDVAVTVRVNVSDREVEVLGALAAGRSNAQIANRLHISVRTVEGHVSSLLRKYGVADRRALAQIAADLPVAPSPDEVAGLPGWRTTFVGRVAEQSAVAAALAESRLVTLVGPGGVGKTRLAVRMAEKVATGGAFVDLAAARAGSVSQVVATVLGVMENSHQPLDAAILARLRRGETLLVLDNCEHVIEVAARLAEEILSACPPTRLLVTSREGLAVAGERVVPVGPLPLGSDAEELFVQRTEVTAAERASVALVCAQVDGLPLAIELAAARYGGLGAEGVLTGLGDRLRLLSGGRGTVQRHRSLRAVLGWSYDLLDTEERVMFRALGSFAGEFDLAAVAAVSAIPPAVAADVLGRLVDKSLVTPCRDRASRWRLLETVRAFAAAELDAGDDGVAVRRRHLWWATDVASALRDRLGGRWDAQFDAVAGELRAALDAAPPGPDEQVHRLAVLLARLSFARRFLVEALGRYRDAAARTRASDDAAQNLVAAADCAMMCSDYDEAFELCLAAAQRAGSGPIRAVALAKAVEVAGRYAVVFRDPVPLPRRIALLTDARAAAEPADSVTAARMALAEAWTTGSGTPEAALADRARAAAEATGDPALVVAALDACRAAAAPMAAHRFATRGLELAQRLDPTDPAQAVERDDATGRISLEAVVAGDLPTARSVAALALGDEPNFLSLINAIPANVLSGNLDQAVQFADAMWTDWQQSGRPRVYWMWVTLPFVVLAHGLRGDEQAAESWRARLNELTGTSPSGQIQRLRPLSAYVATRIAVHTGDTRDAPALVAHIGTLTTGRYLPYARAGAAELAVVAALPEAADILAAASACPDHPWAAACLTRASGRLRGDRSLLAQSIGQWERLGARVERACTLLLLPDRVEEGHAELATLGVARVSDR